MNKSTIYLNNSWLEIPAGSGMIPGTELKAQWLTDNSGNFKLTKLVLTNCGKTPVKLGSCHLLESDELPDFSAQDMVFLDSGGGWPCGCSKTTDYCRSPRFTSEYWNTIFLAEEDIAWAGSIMSATAEELNKGVPGANYSFGGVAAVQHQSYGTVYSFTAPVKRCNTAIYFLCDPADGSLRRLAMACNFANYELKAGERIESEEMAIADFADAQQGLEAWADMCAERSNVVLRHTVPPVGWLSWYGYRLTISAEEINKIADFINENFPGFGFKYMQIDLGYSSENMPGRWQQPNERFPEGLEKFAEDMRERGFIPGIWCSMYLGESCTVPAGHIGNSTKWFWEPHEPVSYFDPTHPAVKDYVAETMRYYKSLGIKYFKIDFVNRLGRTDEVYDPYDKTLVKGAQIYRKALQELIAEMDSDDFLYACSDLTMHSIGLCSITMSACDIGNTGIREKREAFEFFQEQFNSTMSRYFVQNKLIMLTPDSINIAPPADLEEARMRVLFVGMAGGQIFLGDKFQDSTPEIIDLVRRVLPPYGRAAKPVNMFGSEKLEIFKYNTPGRDIYNFFNFDFDNEKVMPLEFPDDREYDVWNFFEQRYEGRFKGTFAPVLPRAAARCYAATPVTEEPRVIGTTFHFTCGAVELSSVEYANGVLTGKLTRPAGDRGKIFIMDTNNNIHSLEFTGTGKAEDWSFER